MDEVVPVSLEKRQKLYDSIMQQDQEGDTIMLEKFSFVQWLYDHINIDTGSVNLLLVSEEINFRKMDVTHLNLGYA